MDLWLGRETGEQLIIGATRSRLISPCGLPTGLYLLEARWNKII